MRRPYEGANQVKSSSDIMVSEVANPAGDISGLKKDSLQTAGKGSDVFKGKHSGPRGWLTVLAGWRAGTG